MKATALILLIALLTLPLCAHMEEDLTQPAPENLLRLSFVGDCSLGEDIKVRGLKNQFSETIDRLGLAWPFSTVAPWLKADDCTFANLEVVLTDHARNKSGEGYDLIGRPAYAQCLVEGGVDVVNTVNNHCLDFQAGGYQDTLTAVEAVGIMHFGTRGVGTAYSSDILGTITCKGVKIGLVGYSYPQDWDVKRIVSRMQKLRADGCQLVFVSLHWGRETHMTPESWQYDFARQLIDAGADAVWGHHPHVLQPVCLYKGKPVLFSTGNFVFGYASSELDASTGIFQLDYALDEDGTPYLIALRVIPLEVGGRGDFRPRVLTDSAERAACLKKLIGRAERKNWENLPAAFTETGLLTFPLPDGFRPAEAGSAPSAGESAPETTPEEASEAEEEAPTANSLLELLQP